MITYSHSMGLALASIVVSIVASITALALMKDLRLLSESKRKAVIVMSAFVLGGGIWSMHFLAILSLQFSVPVHYDLLQTLSSGLISVLVVGFALLLLHFRRRTPMLLTTAGLALGVGIVSMHYVGMLGMRGLVPDFNVIAILAGTALALVTGVVAVRVSYASRTRQNIVKGGVIFGLSVVLVHYTAMIGTGFAVDPSYDQQTIALSQSTLAIAVTLAAFCICGAFLLAASTFVPAATTPLSNAGSDAPANPDVVAGSNLGASLMAEDAHSPVHAPAATPERGPGPVAQPESGAAGQRAVPTPVQPSTKPSTGPSAGPISWPIAGPIAGPSTPQSTGPIAESVPAASMAHSTEEAATPRPRVPYEEHKQIKFVPSDEVGALRADGRYTQLYTRNGVKFCPWSITEADKRLTPSGFYRSHRSYLINVHAVAGFKKTRESGVCSFEGFAQLGSVPVSRARVGDLIEALGL